MTGPANSYYGCPPGSVIVGGKHRIAGNQRVSIWGQSNAAGWAERSDISSPPLSSDSALATLAAGTFSRVYIWNGSAYVQLNSTNHKAGGGGQFGPEFGLAVRWMRETTSGNLYIEKEAVGNTSIDYYAPGSAAYITAQSNRSAANAWLVSNGITVADAGWVWVQGEYDYQQTQAWYQTRLSTLISTRTSDGFQTANTKRLLMDMVPGSFCYSANIVSAKAAVASTSPSNTASKAMAPIFSGYMNSLDLLHANARGQVYMGYLAFEYVFSATHIGI